MNGPNLYYKKTSQANTISSWKIANKTLVGSDFTFTIDYTKIGGIAYYDTIQYFIVAQDTISVPNYSISSGALNGAFSSSILKASDFPISGAIDSYPVLPEFADSIVTVGVGGKFTSLTNDDTLGLFKALNRSILTKNLTVEIISDLNESGINGLNNIPKLNSIQYGIRIQADTNILRTISGDYNGGLIRIQDITNLSIDGAFNGRGQYLKFINSPSGSVTKASTIQLINTGLGFATKNISIKNSIIVGTAQYYSFNLCNFCWLR